MKPINNTFSMKRLMLLEREQWVFNKMNLLWTVVGALGSSLFVVVANSSHLRPGAVAESAMMNGLFAMILFITFLVGIGFVHTLIHQNNVMAYSSIPASYVEKYVQIILTGIVYYFMAILIIQIGILTEIVLTPSLGETLVASEHPLLFRGTVIFNPFFLFLYPVASTICLAGLAMLVCVLFRHKQFAYIALFAVVFVLIRLIKWVEQYFTDRESFGQIVFYSAIVMAVVCFVASFFALRKIQQKS